MTEAAVADTIIANRGARLVLSLVQTPGGWEAQFHGAQIDLALERGADQGAATVHIEANGHSGLSVPPWADPGETVRAAATLLAQIAPSIPQDAARSAPRLLADAAARVAAQAPKGD